MKPKNQKFVHTTNNRYSQAEKELLIQKYSQFKATGDLQILANSMGRTVDSISSKAAKMGLRDKSVLFDLSGKKEMLSRVAKKRIEDNGHPKGMLGKSQTEKQKKAVAESNSKRTWTEERKQAQSDKMSKGQANGMFRSQYSNGKNGWCWIGDKYLFFRSSWEPNIASYLEFQKQHGIIKEWEYESDVFWFEAIKRGVRSYKPDFKITRPDGSQYFIEVKGWMDKKSQTKLKRMKKYHPNVDVELIDSKRYKDISKQSSLYKFWGQELKPKDK